MEFYLNEEKADVIKKYFEIYPFDGITTNTKMIGALGKVAYADTIRGLRKAIGEEKKLFTQVTSDTYEDMLAEGRFIVELGGPNTYIKVPVNETGIKVLRTLHEMGYRTLGTICLTAIQAVIALQAGADYVAVFYNYMVQAGYDADKTMKDIAGYIRESSCSGQMMGVGNKKMEQFSSCISDGCTAININAGTLTEWMYNEPSVSTLKDFMSGWTETWGNIRIRDFIG